MKYLFFRVTDGNRTRDNRYHNPLSKKSFRALSVVRRALASGRTRVSATVGAPGPDCDPLAALARWGCP